MIELWLESVHRGYRVVTGTSRGASKITISEGFGTIAQRCFPLSFRTRWFQFSLWCLPKPITTTTIYDQRTLRLIHGTSRGTLTHSTDICSRTRVGFFLFSRARCNPNGIENHPSAGITLRNQDHHHLVFDGGIAKFRYQYQGRSIEVLDLSLWPRLPLGSRSFSVPFGLHLALMGEGRKLTLSVRIDGMCTARRSSSVLLLHFLLTPRPHKELL